MNTYEDFNNEFPSQVEPPLYSTPGKSSSSYQQSSKDQTNYSSDNKKYPSEGYKEDVDPSSTSYLTVGSYSSELLLK